MKKIIRLLSVIILFCFFFGTNIFAEELTKKDLEDVIVVAFHNQIASSLKNYYDLDFVQFENAHITSIKKEYLPESSEEMKPGNYYEITLEVKVLNVPENKSIVKILLSNDQKKR